MVAIVDFENNELLYIDHQIGSTDKSEIIDSLVENIGSSSLFSEVSNFRSLSVSKYSQTESPISSASYQILSVQYFRGPQVKHSDKSDDLLEDVRKRTAEIEEKSKSAKPRPVNTIFGRPFLAHKSFTAKEGWVSYDRNPRFLADVNGDGSDDIIGIANHGILVSLSQVSYDNKVSFSKPYTATTSFALGGGWYSFDRYPRHVADVNGDGRADIIGFGYYGTVTALGQRDGTFGPLINAGTGFSVAHGWRNFNASPRHVADVNGDGRADIVGFNGKHVLVSLGQRDGTFSQQKIGSRNFSHDGGWVSFDRYPRQLADINGDGRADIVGFSEHYIVTAFGQTDGTFGNIKVGPQKLFTHQGGGWDSADKHSRQLADVNGDGAADIIGFGSKGTFVAFSQRNGHFDKYMEASKSFGARSSHWRSQNLFPRVIGDINGDKIADIVGFTDFGVGSRDSGVYAALGREHIARYHSD